jgi:hypothetical protein
MKLNIKRLQEGGGMPFVTYRPAPSMTTPDTSSAETTSSKSSKKSDSESDSPSLLSKGVIDELIKKGLPNDVNKFLSDLQSAEKSSLMGMESGVGGIDRNKLYSLASKANQLIHNSNLMESATKQAYDNDGLEELAVSATGQLFVQDKQGKIAQISMGDYTKKKDSVYALTVNDLSKARMYNPNLAFDTEIIATIQNSMGINKINDYMLGIINKLGTETLNKEGYIDKQKLKETIVGMQGKNPTESELKGIQELASTYQNMGKDGIYKVTTENSSQRNHISDGFEYLWALLPNNARNVLKARYVVDGNESANPVNIIRNAFIKHTNESNSSKLDYPAGMNKEEGSGDGSGSVKQHNLGSLENLMDGSLGNTVYSLNNPNDPSYSINLVGNTIGQVTTANEDIVPATTLTNTFDSGIGKLIDKNNIYFGDQKISQALFNKIIYNGEEVAKVWMPVNALGEVDFNLLPLFQAAEEEIKSKNITSPSDKNAIYQKHRVPMSLDASGKPNNFGKVQEYLVFTGASSTAITKPSKNAYVFELPDDMQDLEKERLELIYKKSGSKDNPLEYPDDNNWFGLSNVIKGPVFMKLTNTAKQDAAMMVKKGSLVNTPTLQQDLINQKKNTINASSYNLFN